MESNEIKYENKENEMIEVEGTVEEFKTENNNRGYHRDPVKNRFFKFLGVLFKIADISGFRILNRLEIQDKKTGRIFK